MTSPTSPTSPMELDHDRDPELKNMVKTVRDISIDNAKPSSSPQSKEQSSLGIPTYKKIGEGGCSAVFAQKGESIAIKISKESKFGQWNDYVMQTLIYEEIKRHEVDVLVPKCYFFVPADDHKFFQMNPALVEAARGLCDIPTDILVCERIPPLDDVTRADLINKYCAPRLRLKALADPKNDDCLVKIYLGSMEGRTGETPFSLTNFELHLNQMVEIDLDVDRMASAVGQALAVMHWAASVDAWGVQFVLGGSDEPFPPSYLEIEEMEPSTYTGPKSRVIEHFFRRRTVLWMLNFDQVQPITMDAAGVSQAVDAAVLSDIYLPRRYSRSPVEKRVWDKFRDQYIETSNLILQHEDRKIQQLPHTFLDRISKVELRKKGAWARD